MNSPIRSDRECPIWETDPYPKHKNKLICVGGYVEDDYAPSTIAHKNIENDCYCFYEHFGGIT